MSIIIAQKIDCVLYSIGLSVHGWTKLSSTVSELGCVISATRTMITREVLKLYIVHSDG